MALPIPDLEAKTILNALIDRFFLVPGTFKYKPGRYGILYVTQGRSQPVQEINLEVDGAL